MSRFILWTLSVIFITIVFLLHTEVIPKDNLLELIEKGLDFVQKDPPALFDKGGVLRFWD